MLHNIQHYQFFNGMFEYIYNILPFLNIMIFTQLLRHEYSDIYKWDIVALAMPRVWSHHPGAQHTTPGRRPAARAQPPPTQPTLSRPSPSASVPRVARRRPATQQQSLPLLRAATARPMALRPVDGYHWALAAEAKAPDVYSQQPPAHATESGGWPAAADSALLPSRAVAEVRPRAVEEAVAPTQRWRRASTIVVTEWWSTLKNLIQNSHSRSSRTRHRRELREMINILSDKFETKFRSIPRILSTHHNKRWFFGLQTGRKSVGSDNR